MSLKTVQISLILFGIFPKISDPSGSGPSRTFQEDPNDPEDHAVVVEQDPSDPEDIRYRIKGTISGKKKLLAIFFGGGGRWGEPPRRR